MRNQPNTQILRADKRFDALVKQEMVEHQHIISSHHKEMQTLRDNLSLAMEKFESLSKHGQKELNDFKDDVARNSCMTKEKLISHESIIADQRKTIESLHQQLNEFHEIYASKTTVEKVRKELGIGIKENTTSHINSFQDFQRELKILINSVQKDLIKLTNDMDQNFSKLILDIESNFKASSLDKEGVLKEIRVYKKNVFIVEKKIENIYTLIERINKRGGVVCRKPE